MMPFGTCRDLPTCDDGCGELGFCKELMITGVNTTNVDADVVVNFTSDTSSHTSTSATALIDASVDVDADIDSDPIKMTFLANFTWDSQACTPPVTFRDPPAWSSAEMRMDPGRDKDMTRNTGGDLADDVACVPQNTETISCCALPQRLACRHFMNDPPPRNQKCMHLQ